MKSFFLPSFAVSYVSSVAEHSFVIILIPIRVQRVVRVVEEIA